MSLNVVGLRVPRLPVQFFTPRNRALGATYITIGIDMLGSALTVPVMPFFVETLGGDASTLGLLFSTFAVCQMLATSWMVPVRHFESSLSLAVACWVC